jgi:large subunit ribosomal protein L4
MPEINVINMQNQEIAKIALPDSIYASEIRKDVLHEVVINYLANQRQGNAATKTKGLVSGGGKKPWRQKGTGRARAGSIRSPLWRGGGTVFGPLKRDYKFKVNQKLKRLALKSVLSAKYQDNKIIVIDEISVAEPKTKLFVSILENLKLTDKTVLIILDQLTTELALAARNLPRVNMMLVKDIHAYNILAYEMILINQAAIEKLQEGLM